MQRSVKRSAVRVRWEFSDTPYNLNGYYNSLKALLAHMIEAGLSSKERQEGIYFAESLDEINSEVICLNCPEGESLGDIGLPGIVVTPETVADFIAQQDKEYEALAPYKP